MLKKLVDKEIIEFFINFKFPQKPIKKENIFDVGIRNMYENPFTEILSFILSSNTTFNKRNEFIKNFIFGLTRDKNISESFCQELKVGTQITTNNGKRMDMILYNNKYVIVLENKIEHILINPLEDYESEINTFYPAQEKLYYIFSLHEVENKGKWTNKLIGDVFLFIKKGLQFGHDNKWDYFVEDFLDHYIKEKTQMTDEEFDLCEKHFSKFILGIDLLEQFIGKIEIKLEQIIQPQRIKRESWIDKSIALRLNLFETDDISIVFWLYYDNNFYIQIYYDNNSKKSDLELMDTVGDKYTRHKDGKCIQFELKKEYCFKSIEEVYKEIEIQWKNMKQIYKSINQ